jgi:hypothetical protein
MFDTEKEMMEFVYEAARALELKKARELMKSGDPKPPAT